MRYSVKRNLVSLKNNEIVGALACVGVVFLLFGCITYSLGLGEGTMFTLCIGAAVMYFGLAVALAVFILIDGYKYRTALAMLAYAGLTWWTFARGEDVCIRAVLLCGWLLATIWCAKIITQKLGWT